MSTRISRRQVLALIALADAPMPVEVDFSAANKSEGDHVQLRFDHIEQAKQWGPILGIPATDIERADNTYRYVNDTGEQITHYTVYVRPWRGWRVLSLLVIERQAPDAPIDDATREQLATIAAGGDAR